MMTPQQLEALILELMKDIYNADYIGKLKVEEIGEGFLIKIGMQTPEVPITIYTEEKGDKLIKFLKKELRDRNLDPHYFGSISLVYRAVCNNVQNKKCCDKR